MDLPRPLFGLFSSLKQALQILQQLNVKISSKRCWYSNPQPLEHESPPTTTRPELPPTSVQSWSTDFDLLKCCWKCNLFQLSEMCIFQKFERNWNLIKIYFNPFSFFSFFLLYLFLLLYFNLSVSRRPILKRSKF